MTPYRHPTYSSPATALIAERTRPSLAVLERMANLAVAVIETQGDRLVQLELDFVMDEHPPGDDFDPEPMPRLRITLAPAARPAEAVPEPENSGGWKSCPDRP